jgi:hypothetical protein
MFPVRIIGWAFVFNPSLTYTPDLGNVDWGQPFPGLLYQSANLNTWEGEF